MPFQHVNIVTSGAFYAENAEDECQDRATGLSRGANGLEFSDRQCKAELRVERDRTLDFGPTNY